MSGEQRRYVENIRLAADVLLEEINEILDYSKLESGRMTFENKNFNLRHLTDTNNLKAGFNIKSATVWEGNKEIPSQLDDLNGNFCCFWLA